MEMVAAHTSLTESLAITEKRGKEILMVSRGTLTVQRVTSVDPVLTAELDTLFGEAEDAVTEADDRDRSAAPLQWGDGTRQPTFATTSSASRATIPSG
jgi:hypothetical protein